MSGGRSETLPYFESLRMALMITLHHKYVQLSSSNRVLPIHSRIGVVITLGLELWPSITIARPIYASFKTCSLCCIVDGSSETVPTMTVIPVSLVEPVYRLQTTVYVMLARHFVIFAY